MKDPLGVSPSKGNQGTTRGKEKIILTSVGIEPTTSGLDLPLEQLSPSQPRKGFATYSDNKYIFVDGLVIERMVNVKLLGIQIYDKLNFTRHITELCIKTTQKSCGLCAATQLDTL